MSSMLTPFENDLKADDGRGNTTAGQQQRSTSSIKNAMEAEHIPTYAESSTQSRPSPPPQPSQPDALARAPEEPSDEPPAYTPLDSSQTTFMIYGTFIHTPVGPAYQLSSPLDTRASPFRIRRLRPKEIPQVGATPIAFDKTQTLYEVTDPPLLDNEYHLRGMRRSCLGGVLELKFKLSKWRVTHIVNKEKAGKEILTSKRTSHFGIGRATLNRKHEEESSEWKDSTGRVVATEVFRKLDDGGVVPVIELSKDLDQTWRELLLSLWAARLWVAVGKEKSAVLGVG